MTSGGTPRVLLVDPESWDAFVSLASALRHRGVAVTHVTTRPTDFAAAVNSALRTVAFGRRRVRLPDEHLAQHLALLKPLVADPTVDVQGPECEVSAMRHAGVWPLTSLARRVPQAIDWCVLYDKWEMSEFAKNHGIPVPEAWDVAPAGELPIVVKGRTGSGGASVHVAFEADVRDEAARRIDADNVGEVFYQRHVVGDSVPFGGVAHGGTILAGAVYRMIPAPDDPMGPAAAIELLELPSVCDGVTRLIGALGYTGFFCVDYVAPPEAPALLSDFNPRVFGGWLAMQQAGVDLLGAYLSVLGVDVVPTVGKVRVGAQENVRVLPRDAAHRWSDIPIQCRTAGRAIRRAVPITGWRFGAVSAVGSALLLAREAARLATGAAR